MTESEILDEIKVTAETFYDVEAFSMGRKKDVYVWGKFHNALTRKLVIYAIQGIHPSLSVEINPSFETGPPWDPQVWENSSWVRKPF